MGPLSSTFGKLPGKVIMQYTKNRPFKLDPVQVEGAKFFKKGQHQDGLRELNLEQDQLNLRNKITT